jgi:uncharacterized membrane protein AbrB (regulator of aidB expression)
VVKVDEWLKRMLGWCLTFLVSMLALSWAIELFKCLLPWLIGIAVALGIGLVTYCWIRHRHHW